MGCSNEPGIGGSTTMNEDRDEIASGLVRWWMSDTDEMDRALVSWCCTDDAQETARATVDFVLDAVRLSRRTHGKPGTYTAGCRCDECREAWRGYRADRPRPVSLPDPLLGVPDHLAAPSDRTSEETET